MICRRLLNFTNCTTTYLAPFRLSSKGLSSSTRAFILLLRHLPDRIKQPNRERSTSLNLKPMAESDHASLDTSVAPSDDISAPKSHIEKFVNDIAHATEMFRNADGKERFWRETRSNWIEREKQRLNSFRQWENVGESDGHSGRNSPATFTIMTYNVLSQTLLHMHPHLYRNHDRSALGWDNRMRALFEEITKHNPDIFCLQEVEEEHLHQYEQYFQDRGYQFHYKKRYGDKPDGCATFYRAEKFVLRESFTVEFTQNDVCPNENLLSKPQIAIITYFALRANERLRFIVANTHLLYNPRRNDVRLAQMQILLAEIDRVAFKGANTDYYPVIICGDFNSLPNSPVYEYVARGEFVYRGKSLYTLDTIQTSRETPRDTLLPKQLMINDASQHAWLAQHRRTKKTLLNRTTEYAEMTALFNSDSRTKKIDTLTRDTKQMELDENSEFGSGKITHGFHFKSIHENEDQCATTYQDRWITVDFMFYSVGLKQGQLHSELDLLSRFALPSKKACETLPSIPNLVYGSDHLLLMAQFSIKPTNDSPGSASNRKR